MPASRTSVLENTLTRTPATKPGVQIPCLVFSLSQYPSTPVCAVIPDKLPPESWLTVFELRPSRLLGLSSCPRLDILRDCPTMTGEASKRSGRWLCTATRPEVRPKPSGRAARRRIGELRVSAVRARVNVVEAIEISIRR
jgi:hypothetical protein